MEASVTVECADIGLRQSRTTETDTSLRSNLKAEISSFRLNHDLPRLGLGETWHQVPETEAGQLTVEFVEGLAPFLFGGAEPPVPGLDRGTTAIEFLRQIIPHALGQRAALVRRALRR